MNSRFFIIVLMITIISGCAKPSIVLQDFENEQMIHHSQIKNTDYLANYFVYLNKGDIVPLKMTLDSELLDIANEEINLILKQKVYFRVIIPEGINADDKSAMSEKDKQEFIKNIMIFVSPDAKRWAQYIDIKAVEQLFGIKGGSISFGMGITKEEGLTMSLNAKINRI